ncbi:MAG: recombinase family protein [Clostridia bacterium]|nr:recombinase family protein [Clostridia bacterium]
MNTMKSDRRAAVAYMRYSSHHQTENSIEYQRKNIIDYCNAHDIELVEEFVDAAHTGTNDRRPSLQKMFQAVQSKPRPEWDAILVFDLSRFARNAADAFHYRAILYDHNVELISITQDYGDSDEAQLILGIHHLFDAQYSLKNARHTHSGMMTKALKALHCGGKPPLGFDLDINKKLVVNQREAIIVQEIFDLYELNYSYDRMIQILNEKGYRTKKGNPFQKNSFREILTQEKYIGTFRWNRVRKKNRRGHRNNHEYKPKEEQIIIPHVIPAIIDEDQFNRVQEKLSGRANGMAESKARQHYMLSGIKVLKCAECGSYMIGNLGNSHGNKYKEYYCPNHKSKTCSTKNIRAEQLDHWVAGWLAKDFYDRSDVNKINATLKYNDYYSMLTNHLAGLKERQRNIVRAVSYGYTPVFTTNLKELSKEIQSTEAELSKIEAETLQITPENKKALTKKLARKLIDSDDLAVKKYLKSMIQEIVISNKSISMTTVDF